MAAEFNAYAGELAAIDFPSSVSTQVSNAKSAAAQAADSMTRQLSSNDRLVNAAIASAQAGVNTAQAASANDPGYTKLRTDAVALLEDVVRQQIQQRLSGRPVDASRYPASYRDTVKRLKADCP